jgi:nucleoid-associated protein YgaU
VIHVVTAVITAKGETIMTTTTESETTPEILAEEQKASKATKKAHAGARRANVAPARANAGKKASHAKKAPAGPKKAKVAKPEARDGSRSAKILDLLKRPGGATSKDLQKATGWQPHSVRGFLSGTIGKKMGLAVTSTKGEDGERSYRLCGAPHNL